MMVKIGFLFAFIPKEGLLINSPLVTGLIIMQPIQDHPTTLNLLPGLPNSIKENEKNSIRLILIFVLLFCVSPFSIRSVKAAFWSFVRQFWSHLLLVYPFRISIQVYTNTP